MGFFSDLKEDLNQAVNEMMPEQEESEAVSKEAKEDIQEDIKDILDNIETAAAEEEKVEKEEKKVSSKASDEVAIVTSGMKVLGNVESDGSLDLYGSITGNVSVSGKLNVLGCVEGDSKASEIYCEKAKITGELSSTGSIKVGKESVVIGNLFATSAVIAGAVKGDIDVKGPVILDTSAIVMGNIKSKSVQINNGAVIEGICSQCYADVSPSSFFEEIKKRTK